MRKPVAVSIALLTIAAGGELFKDTVVSAWQAPAEKTFNAWQDWAGHEVGIAMAHLSTTWQKFGEPWVARHPDGTMFGFMVLWALMSYPLRFLVGGRLARAWFGASPGAAILWGLSHLQDPSDPLAIHRTSYHTPFLWVLGVGAVLGFILPNSKPPTPEPVQRSASAMASIAQSAKGSSHALGTVADAVGTIASAVVTLPSTARRIADALEEQNRLAAEQLQLARSSTTVASVSGGEPREAPKAVKIMIGHGLEAGASPTDMLTNLLDRTQIQMAPPLSGRGLE